MFDGYFARARCCMAVVSSCCRMWCSVTKRTQPERGGGHLDRCGNSVILSNHLRYGISWWLVFAGALRAPQTTSVAKRNAAEVKSLWPISAGLHTCYKGEDSGPCGGNPKRIPKNQVPSSNCGLQLARMKLKSLVIVNHHVTVKIHRTLHTPPITPEKCSGEDMPGRRYPRGCRLGGPRYAAG